MSRFANLEFSGEFEEPLREETRKDEGYYFAQAEAAFRAGCFEQGLRAYAKVLEFNPDHAAAWAGQVRMLIELAEFKEAKLWADKGLEKFPHAPELLAAKGVALAREGDLKAAMAFSDAAFEERGDTPYLWLARGDVLLARREKRADYCFQRAFQAAPTDWFWRWLASRVLAFYQRFARAFKLAREAIELDSGQAVLWLELGQCQLALGLFGQARNSYDQARQLDPDHPGIDGHLRELARTTSLRGRIGGWFRRHFGK